jgi:hypothetical protein
LKAYNHFIKFDPPLKGQKEILEPCENVILISECAIDDSGSPNSHTINYTNNQGREIAIYTLREELGTKNERRWFFEIKGVVTFFWLSGSRTIKYVKKDNFTESLCRYWGLHTVLPLYFTLEDTYIFLHAGAVEIDGKPILFTAESFGGKSTMTDFFMKKGHTMISDDKVATYEKDGRFYSVPSHPYHRPHRGIEDLGFSVHNMAKKPNQIYVIYTLEKSPPNSKIHIVELSGVEKFKSLQYASELNIDFQKQKRFEYFMKMANTVPVYKITVPWDIERLDEVYLSITIHNQSLRN